ncbi:MAG: hypothetical protein ACTSU2_10090 [Promethearchaeota archaeon]
MPLMKNINDYIGYIKNNFQMIISAGIASILLILGPIMALLIRLGGGNYGVIILVGVIFELIGMVSFWYYIKKFLKDREEEAKNLKNKK